MNNVCEQLWDGIGYEMHGNFRLGRNRNRRVTIRRDIGPTMWKYGLEPAFEQNNLELKRYGMIERRTLNAHDMLVIGIQKTQTNPITIILLLLDRTTSNCVAMSRMAIGRNISVCLVGPYTAF